jgi:hypothetical protein
MWVLKMDLFRTRSVDQFVEHDINDLDLRSLIQATPCSSISIRDCGRHMTFPFSHGFLANRIDTSLCYEFNDISAFADRQITNASTFEAIHSLDHSRFELAAFVICPRHHRAIASSDSLPTASELIVTYFLRSPPK